MNRPADRATPACQPSSVDRPAAERVDVAVVAAWREGPAGPLVLVTRRPSGVHLAGPAELPGGKVEPGECPLEAARRELAEETGLSAEQWTALGTAEHDYADRRVRLHLFLARVAYADIDPARCVGGHRWVPSADLDAVPFPPANDPLTALISEALRTRIPIDDQQ